MVEQQKLRGMNKRQELQDILISQYGSLGAAFEAITGARLFVSPESTKSHWEETRGFRKYNIPDFEQSARIVHVLDGSCAKTGNFFGMLAAFEGEDGFSNDRYGYDLAESHVFAKGHVVSNFDVEAFKAKGIELEKQAQLKRDENKAKGVALFTRKAPAEVSLAVYESYMKFGRNIKIFTSKGLSSHVCLVEDVTYWHKDDKIHNGNKFPAMVFPYTKRESDGSYKIHGLHLIYLQKEGNKYVKAKVLCPKQDFSAWSLEPGLAVNLSVSGSSTLFVGEGNETVSSYYAAFSVLESGNADFKFTNTASRLANVCLEGYEHVNVLVDRDRSGAGMMNAMKLRHRAQKSGKHVTLLPPPSGKVPLYIYVGTHSEAVDLNACIAECQYWRSVDKAFASEAKNDGDAYVDRYQSFVVVPDNFDYEGSYPYVIKESEIPNDIPKGLDWDDVIQHGASFAFELFNLYKRAAMSVAA